jgi:hypothetical protein
MRNEHELRIYIYICAMLYNVYVCKGAHQETPENVDRVESVTQLLH